MGKTKVIVSLSGGMDSTTVLARALSVNRDVQCVGFSYGSKHNAYENAAGIQIAQHYDVPFKLIDFSSVTAGFKSNLLKSGDAIPEGFYEGENMRQTVVPGRNLIFISILMGIAWSNDAEEVWLGIHAGDHFIYPDCRPNFFKAMNEAVQLGSDGKVQLVAPFLDGNKTSIIKEGLELGVPYHLTRTCYKDQVFACGKCGSCQERLDAFHNNGIEDPIPYTTRELIPKT